MRGLVLEMEGPPPALGSFLLKGHPLRLEGFLLKDHSLHLGQKLWWLAVMDGVSSLSVSKRKSSLEANSVLMAKTMWHKLILPLSLDFLVVTVVHYSSSSIKSGCTYMTPPSGAKIGTNSFSWHRCGLMLTIHSSAFGIEFTIVGTSEDCPNCRKEVLLAKTVFCSGPLPPPRLGGCP